MINTATKKQVAGGCNTTTATTNNATKIIAIFTLIKAIYLRFADSNISARGIA
jgi:hypothetical protein